MVSEVIAGPTKKHKTGGSTSSKRSEAQTNAATPNLIPQVQEIKATHKDEGKSSSLSPLETPGTADSLATTASLSRRSSFIQSSEGKEKEKKKEKEK